MDYLVIFDTTGFIIDMKQGSNLREPIGIPFAHVNIPIGKRLIKMDVTRNAPTPVFEDLPKTDLELLQAENTKIKLALAELAELVGGAVNG